MLNVLLRKCQPGVFLHNQISSSLVEKMKGAIFVDIFFAIFNILLSIEAGCQRTGDATADVVFISLWHCVSAQRKMKTYVQYSMILCPIIYTIHMYTLYACMLCSIACKPSSCEWRWSLTTEAYHTILPYKTPNMYNCFFMFLR